MESDQTSQLAVMIDRLTARFTAPAQPLLEPHAAFTRWQFIRVQSLTRFWEDESRDLGDLRSSHERLLRGLYALDIPWAFVAVGDGREVSFHFGRPRGQNTRASWKAAFAGCFPGCELMESLTPEALTGFVADLPFRIAVTGNPSYPVDSSSKREGKPAEVASLEFVFKAMRETTWAYMVLGKPVPGPAIREVWTWLANEEREIVSAYLRRGTPEENNNPEARHYVELLRIAREKHEIGEREGMWDVCALLFGGEADALRRGAQALLGALAGPDSRPQPMRLHDCSTTVSGSFAPVPGTRLTTAEAVALARLPAEEFPGYRLRRPARFAVSIAQPPPAKALSVGVILDDQGRTANWFEIRLEDVAKHAIVVGVPGSGKTRTCQYLLRQLWEEFGVPWLVLEPSMKTEYRSLLAAPVGRDLRIFTVGDELTAPFRVNPLEVLPGVHVQTHIDALEAVLQAAFGWVVPMQYVLSLALHRVYADRGWDFVSGSHPKGYAGEVQPTLADLARTIERLVPELGYDSEITSNILAGLQTRLSTLRAGAKGLMLDCHTSIPMDYLLGKPTILEFASIGNDEQKAFLMGVMLIRLTEHQQTLGPSDGRLRHVTLVEEAHRLLMAVPERLSSEEANPRGKAVETFCNLLAEIRAYGEGIILAEQIATKLALDALKNTNLKVVHRLVAEDERKAVGGCMALSVDQERCLSTLRCGEAVVYAEGCNEAYLIRVPDHARHHAYGQVCPTNRTVAQQMQDKMPNVMRMSTAPHGDSSGASPAPLLGRCTSCDRERCPVQGRIVAYLLHTDHAEEFAKAVEGGWDDLWGFGSICAQEIWSQECIPADAAYCVVMTVASVAGFDVETCEKVSRNLRVVRQKAKG